MAYADADVLRVVLLAVGFVFFGALGAGLWIVQRWGRGAASP